MGSTRGSVTLTRPGHGKHLTFTSGSAVGDVLAVARNEYGAGRLVVNGYVITRSNDLAAGKHDWIRGRAGLQETQTVAGLSTELAGLSTTNRGVGRPAGGQNTISFRDEGPEPQQVKECIKNLKAHLPTSGLSCDCKLEAHDLVACNESWMPKAHHSVPWAEMMHRWISCSGRVPHACHFARLLEGMHSF
ncbi:hypothetical protein WJX73_000883 [Symbiochloris irregularis]|uniref:Uncharacterized protein n=1 Tax=Symbiochloris irregularis TaxID=706552 RepID=A0AAW1PFA3_9CHLO